MWRRCLGAGEVSARKAPRALGRSRHVPSGELVGIARGHVRPLRSIGDGSARTILDDPREPWHRRRLGDPRDARDEHGLARRDRDRCSFDDPTGPYVPPLPPRARGERDPHPPYGAGGHTRRVVQAGRSIAERSPGDVARRPATPRHQVPVENRCEPWVTSHGFSANSRSRRLGAAVFEGGRHAGARALAQSTRAAPGPVLHEERRHARPGALARWSTLARALVAERDTDPASHAGKRAHAHPHIPGCAAARRGPVVGVVVRHAVVCELAAYAPGRRSARGLLHFSVAMVAEPDA